MRGAVRGSCLCLGLVLMACGGNSLPPPHVVAQIEDQKVHYSEFETYLQENSVDSGLALASDVLSELFDQFLEEELLRRIAVERGWIARTDSRRRAVRAVVGEFESITIPPERITAYYRDHGHEFQHEEGVRLRQILVEDRSAAEQVRRRMLSGAPFEEVLADTDVSSTALWGDEGELSAGDLPPVLADTIFQLEPGEVSEVVAADYGFHVFQLVEHLPPEQMELARAEVQIREILRRELVDEGIEGLVAEARERYNVRVFRRNIPFNYAGAY